MDLAHSTHEPFTESAISYELDVTLGGSLSSSNAQVTSTYINFKFEALYIYFKVLPLTHGTFIPIYASSSGNHPSDGIRCELKY